jgi:hypothetical protein
LPRRDFAAASDLPFERGGRRGGGGSLSPSTGAGAAGDGGDGRGGPMVRRSDQGSGEAVVDPAGTRRSGDETAGSGPLAGGKRRRRSGGGAAWARGCRCFRPATYQGEYPR